MASTRVMPGSVIKAYKRKGIKAVVHVFVRTQHQDDTPINCGCALSAKYLTKKEVSSLTNEKADALISKRAQDKGVTFSYRQSFMYAFDNVEFGFLDDPDSKQGYKDGLKTRKLVEKNGLLVVV